jgi:hypothetical protein
LLCSAGTLPLEGKSMKPWRKSKGVSGLAEQAGLDFLAFIERLELRGSPISATPLNAS